jgi:ABC-type uncharacterized transport system substrate-binding protein
MFNPDLPNPRVLMPSVETPARSLKIAPIIAPVRSDGEIETSIIALGREPGGGLVVMPDVFTFVHRAPIISAAARKDFVSELRAADSSYERLPSLADELVRIGADVLLTSTGPAVPALQKATRTIPIVMAGISDPVGSGFIVSLARPGGNTTGVSSNNTETAPKQLELLAAMVSNPSRIGVLGNPETPDFVLFLRPVREAARQARLQLVTLEARNAQEVENAFAAFGSQAVQAVLVVPGSTVFFGMRRS